MLVDTIVLSEEIREQVDALLEHCHCHIPRLIGLSGREREREIKRIINENVYLESEQRILADCKSFRELQAVARIWRMIVE